MSKTFSIDEAVSKVSRYVTFVSFKNKDDNMKRTIYVSESNKRFLRTKDDRGDGPDDAVFVGAKVVESKANHVVFTRSETVDLEEVRRKLGTDYVYIMITVPKNAKDKETRTVIISLAQQIHAWCAF
jgi:glycine cleavage system protein P-like pyridoxal-binding family